MAGGCVKKKNSIVWLLRLFFCSRSITVLSECAVVYPVDTTEDEMCRPERHKGIKARRGGGVRPCGTLSVLRMTADGSSRLTPSSTSFSDNGQRTTDNVPPMPHRAFMPACLSGFSPVIGTPVRNRVRFSLEQTASALYCKTCPLSIMTV